MNPKQIVAVTEKIVDVLRYSGYGPADDEVGFILLALLKTHQKVRANAAMAGVREAYIVELKLYADIKMKLKAKDVEAAASLAKELLDSHLQQAMSEMTNEDTVYNIEYQRLQ